jgi:hypothetical protein
VPPGQARTAQPLRTSASRGLGGRPRSNRATTVGRMRKRSVRPRHIARRRCSHANAQATQPRSRTKKAAATGLACLWRIRGQWPRVASAAFIRLRASPRPPPTWLVPFRSGCNRCTCCGCRSAANAQLRLLGWSNWCLPGSSKRALSRSWRSGISGGVRETSASPQRESQAAVVGDCRVLNRQKRCSSGSQLPRLVRKESQHRAPHPSRCSIGMRKIGGPQTECRGWPPLLSCSLLQMQPSHFTRFGDLALPSRGRAVVVSALCRLPT